MAHSPRFEALCAAARARISEVSVDDIAKRIAAGESFVLIDVREESEFSRGHLPTAKHIGRGILERDIEATVPELDREIVLYCGGGYRSALSAESLQTMGYRNVKSMWGGWREWTKQSLPTET